MNQEERSLAEQAFAADELRLFLDTHPAERSALAAYRGAVQQARQLRDALPDAVNALDAGRSGRWDWVQSPWPWEKEA